MPRVPNHEEGCGREWGVSLSCVSVCAPRGVCTCVRSLGVLSPPVVGTGPTAPWAGQQLSSLRAFFPEEGGCGGRTWGDVLASPGASLSRAQTRGPARWARQPQWPGQEALGWGREALVLGLPGGGRGHAELSSALQPPHLTQDPPLASGRNCSLTPKAGFVPTPHRTASRVAFFRFESGITSVF